MRLAEAPCSRQLLPPQPAHVMPRFSCASLQMLDHLMSEHRWEGRQPEVSLQPPHVMPRLLYESLQMRFAVMLRQSASTSRQLLPPQPADSMPSHAFDFTQIAMSV